MADSTLLSSFRVFSRPLAGLLRDVRWITPNGITMTGVVISFAGIALPVLRPGSYPMALAAAALIFLGTVFDTLDGDLARAQGRSSPFGAWLDGFMDRISEIVYVLVLGWGLPAHVFLTVEVMGDPIAIGSRQLALAALILAYLTEYSGLLWGRHTSLPDASQVATGPQPSAIRSLVRQVGSLLGPASIARQLLLVGALLANRPLAYFPLVCAYELVVLSWLLSSIFRQRRT